MSKYLLSIDNGTQSVRALLFDLQGNLVAKTQVHLQPAYYSEQPGWAEHKAEGYWDAVCAACQRLWTVTDIPRSAIAGVAVTTQRGTVVAVDSDGKPLRAAITWLDQRRTEQVPPIGPLWTAAFKLAGVDGTIDYFRREAEVNWIKAHQPGVWERTHKFLLLSGYLNHCLSGRFADSIGSQVAYMPFDYKRHAWAGARDWKWQALAVRPDQLPELLQPGEVIGAINANASAATGIPEGVPLVAAAADKACEVIGLAGWSRTSAASVTAPRPPSTPPPASTSKSRRSYRHILRPFPAPTAPKCRSSAATGWSTGSRSSLAISNNLPQWSRACRRKRCSTAW